MFSVITASYNSAAFVLAAIHSVQAQTLTDWEMIIVDDCSTDHSVEIIRSVIQQDSRVKLIDFKKNRGPAQARNTAIEEAIGRYIAFLDSDDVWMPNKLRTQLAFMQAHDSPFSFGSYQKIDEQGKVIGHVGAASEVSYRDLLKTSHIGCLTAVYDTDYFGKVYMPLIRKRQDLGLWLKLLRSVPFAHGINEDLGQYRVRSDSLSANKLNAAYYTWRLYRDIEQLGLFESAFYFSHYAYARLVRSGNWRLARGLGILKRIGRRES